MVDERELPDRLRALRGMDVVLPALEGAPPSHLVGGAVRDLLLGREPLDVDIAVEGDVGAVAERLAEALGGEVTVHERFGTATVAAGGADVVNLARTRRETYPEPGALPEVQPAPLSEDLGRRDFTVNALALALNGDGAGELTDPLGGRADLDARLIRVLHERSFVDDPTRLLRAIRYAARLGFAIEADTERWARAAVAAGALATVSGPRVRDELLDLLAEDGAPRAVELLSDLGIAAALHPDLRADPGLVARTRAFAVSADLRRNARRKSALIEDESGATETGADPALAALAALCVGPAVDAASDAGSVAGAGGRAGVGTGGEARAGAGGRTGGGARAGVGVGTGGETLGLADDSLAAWIDRLGLHAEARDAVVRAAEDAPVLVERLGEELHPSRLRALLDGEPAEALALALALGAPEQPVLDYVSRLSGVRLEITGADLLAAGLEESPALGRALAETLAGKLDGEVAGREDELRMALAIARRVGQ